MKIDRTEAICGVSPAILKRLISREHFSTLAAMKDLKLAEPWASETLIALMREGWIEHAGLRDHVDQWRSSDKGNRLAATRLIKRFPVREGRAIIERVVAEARTINADPDSSCRIVEIMLFGSVLTGADDDDAGDIDLVVKPARRRLPEAELKSQLVALHRQLVRNDQVRRYAALGWLRRYFPADAKSNLQRIVPHSELWFSIVDRVEPQLGALARANIQCMGTDDGCSSCGDPADDYLLVNSAEAMPGVPSLRLCPDCLEIRRGGGEILVPIDD